MMEILVGKRLESRSFNQHLEQLLKSDDNVTNVDDSKEDCEDISDKKTSEKTESINGEGRSDEEEEPCDLRIEKCRSRTNSTSAPETESFCDEIKNDDRRLFCKSHQHEGGSCSACDLLTSLDYLRRHRLLCDVIFQVQSNSFYAHRAVMASCSEMYRERYLEEIRNNNQKQLDVLEIEGVPPKVFQKVLDFVYTGKIETDEESVYPLLNAANIMKINSLIHKCFLFIKPRNFCGNVEKFFATSTENESKRCCEDGAQQLRNLRHTAGETLLAHLKKHEFIVRRNQPMMTNTYARHGTVLSKPRLLDLTALKQESHRSCSSSLHSSPSTSRSSEEKIQLQTNDQIKKSNFTDPTTNESRKLNESSLREWLSEPGFNERLRRFQYFNLPSMQHDKQVKENPWANFFRSQMLAKDYRLLFHYGYSPFYNNALTYARQNSAGRSLPNSSFSPYVTLSSSKNNANNIKQSYSNLAYNNKDFSNDVTNPNKGVLDALKRSRSSDASYEDTQARSLNKNVEYNQSSTNVRRTLSDADKSKATQFSTLSIKPLKQDDASKPYSCPLCDAHFNRPANLKTHMRIHSGEKPYKCDTCGARFVQVAHLRAHVLIHTGEKPYPCNVCGTSFRHLQTLKSHLRIHTGEKPYSCENCRVRFRHKSQLRLHLRTKHGVQTNTKKTYKQVPGLRSADISAHIKRAQEAAKSNFSIKSLSSSAYSRNGAVESASTNITEIPMDLHTSQSTADNDDINMFSSDRDHEEFHQNRYKFNVHAHFTKLNDIEDLSKNNAMRPDNCVVSSEK